jgi:hypothetical protein
MQSFVEDVPKRIWSLFDPLGSQDVVISLKTLGHHQQNLSSKEKPIRYNPQVCPMVDDKKCEADLLQRVF